MGKGISAYCTKHSNIGTVQVLLYTQIFNIQVSQLIVSHLCFLYIQYTTVKRQNYAINSRKGMAWHKTGGTLCMMDKNGPFNRYNFHIFEVIVQKGECNNLLHRSTAYIFRIQ